MLKAKKSYSRCSKFALSRMSKLTFKGGFAMKRVAIIDIRRKAPKTWENALDGFTLLRRSQGAAERTILDYERSVTLFFRRFPTAWSSTCRDCFLRHMSQEMSPSTYNIRLKAFRPFFEYCVNEGAFSSSPAEGLKYRRAEPRIVDHSMDDIRKILDAMGAETFATLRDSALLLLQLDSGIRPSEALQLRPSDMNVSDRSAIVRAAIAKTRKGRRVFFSEHTAAVLQKLVDVRPEEWSADAPIFCTAYGTQWSTHAWSVNLRRYAEKAGLKRFSAYDLRHKHALEYLRNGGDIMTLSAGMGHSSLETTQGYLALASSDIRRVHEKASPVQGLFHEKPKRTRAGKL